MRLIVTSMVLPDLSDNVPSRVCGVSFSTVGEITTEEQDILKAVYMKRSIEVLILPKRSL